MTDKTDLIREIHEYVTAHGGENTATHLLVQAASVIQTQAAELEAVGAGGVQALSAGPGAIAKLRHLYQNMVNGAVRDTASAKRIAEGLLAPAIEALERATPPAEQPDLSALTERGAKAWAGVDAQGLRDGAANAGSEPAAWRAQFDAWWAHNRVSTHQVKNIGGFSAKVWHAAIQTVVGATDSTAGFYPADEGSTPSRQATHPSPPEGMVGGWIALPGALPEPGTPVLLDIATVGEAQAFEAWYKQDCVIEGAAAKMAAKAAWKARAMLAASPTPPAEQQAPATEGYVQPVPDKCDRIAWRGRYYHLPLTEQAAPKAAPQPAPHLPERDASLPAERQGLFRKFVVGRVDGSDKPGGKHHGCTYFVLDVDHDPCARPALAAYAAACESTHPTLAADLRTKWGEVPTLQPAPAPLSEQDERRAFEQDFMRVLPGENLKRKFGHYEDPRTRHRWDGWKARAALAAQEHQP